MKCSTDFWLILMLLKCKKCHPILAVRRGFCPVVKFLSELAFILAILTSLLNWSAVAGHLYIDDSLQFLIKMHQTWWYSHWTTSVTIRADSEKLKPFSTNPINENDQMNQWSHYFSHVFCTITGLRFPNGVVYVGQCKAQSCILLDWR